MFSLASSFRRLLAPAALSAAVALLAGGCPNSSAPSPEPATGSSPAARPNAGPAANAPVADAPRLVSAVSTSNTAVTVTFSKPMDASVENPANYSIIQVNVTPEAGALGVVSATRIGDGTAVILRTRSQSELTYELVVTNVRDTGGNVIAAPELLVTPTRTRFAGTPFSGAPDGSCSGGTPDEEGRCFAIEPLSCAPFSPDCPQPGQLGTGTVPNTRLAPDSDCDGLSDAAEQRGWVVTVTLVNGRQADRDVTSDPFDCDSDNDGLGDSLEKNIGADPRSADTDSDEVTDADEWNNWFTDATNQDTDGDTLNDKLELDLALAPTLADTDGDQLDDNVELIERNRNPLIADLPRPQILAENLFLEVDVAYSFTDEEGVTTTIEDTQASTFSQSAETRFGTSDTTSNESVLEFGQSIGGEVSYGVTDGFGGKITAEAEFGQNFTDGYSSTVDSESAQSSTEEVSRSLTAAFSQSQNRSVTRSIEGARVSANVSIRNAGDIAFTITNLEVSLQQQDRRNANRFVPVAALRLSGASDPTNQPSFNLGPFDAARGPFVFENAEIFANRVDELMRAPTGLVLKVVNFDVLDEFGRNFVFSSQETTDRTAGITIDFGDGTVEKYRVAINNSFDASGRVLPITMQRALEIIGINKSDAPLGDVPDADPADPIIRSTYGVRTTEADPDEPNAPPVEVLTRIRGVQNDFVGIPAEKRFWAIITNRDQQAVNQDFSTLQLTARDDYLLVFTQDIDEDGLFFREEAYYGSSDLNAQTDGDELTDFFEVRTGWTVTPIPGEPRKVFPNPGLDDSDGDSLLDDTEFAAKTDPNAADSEFDALTDRVELLGDYDIELFDGDDDGANNNILRVLPYSDAAVVDGGNGQVNTTASGDDQQLIPVGTAGVKHRVIIGPGPNGRIDTTPAGDDVAGIIERLVEGHDGVRSTTVTTGTDDALEITAAGGDIEPGTVLISGGPNGRIDSLPAGDEFVRALHTTLFATDPVNQDTDFDGLSDGREVTLGTNPNRRDAGGVTDRDADGLFDAEEEFGWIVSVRINGVTQSYRAYSDPDRADTDLDGLPDLYERAIASDPTNRDTDRDGKRDGLEFDPDDTDRYYDRFAIERAVALCNAVQNCSYSNPNPIPADRLRTNVNSDDSDGDGLKDGLELDTDFIVRLVSTPQPVVVRSLAYRADSDNDTLNDRAEYFGADGFAPDSPSDTDDTTNPLSADTDGDSRSDSLEVTQIEVDESGNSARTNPLRRDRLVVVEYIDAQVLNDCDDNDGENAGEWAWDFDFDVTGGLQDQNGATSNGLYFGVSDENLPNSLPFFTGLPGGVTTNHTFAFVVAVGGTFNANGTATEDDVAGNADEILTFSQDFTINTQGDFSSTIMTTLSQGSGTCNMNVFVAYSVH